MRREERLRLHETGAEIGEAIVGGYEALWWYLRLSDACTRAWWSYGMPVQIIQGAG